MRSYPFLTPEAEADLDDGFDWYQGQLTGLGHQFLASVERQIERILQHPRLYPGMEQGVRRALTERFPYAIYYLFEDGRVVVLAVLHQARDPDHWKGRL